MILYFLILINMNMNLNNCKIINIVWIERGILLMVIYSIIQNYDVIKNKKIIISNTRVRNFVKSIFYKLDFPNKITNSSKNFYFNIRKVIKNQDIIIDYINNYDEFIPTDKIWLVPYYDMNDPLIMYKHSNTKKIDAVYFKKEILQFSRCPRSNYLLNNKYYDIFWDILFEVTIIKKANTFNTNIYDLINNYLKNNYTNTLLVKHSRSYYPVYRYIAIEPDQNKQSIDFSTCPTCSACPPGPTCHPIQPLNTNNSGTSTNINQSISTEFSTIHQTKVTNQQEMEEFIKLINAKLVTINKLLGKMP